MVIAIAALAVALIGVILVFANPLGGPGAASSPSAGPPSSASPSGVANGCPTSQPAALPAGQTRTVTIQTSKGAIVIKVDGSLAPNAAGNFVALASCGFYDNLIFHRIVPGFVIQGGDPNGNGGGGPGYQFADEPVKGEYVRGTVAMANSGPNTNGSQFFICVADLTTQLAKSYTIFGTVTSGMDSVDQIVSAPRNAQDFPNDPIAMTSVTVANP